MKNDILKAGLAALLVSASWIVAAQSAAGRDTAAPSLPYTLDGTADPSYALLQQQVTDSERGFAATMQRRDFAALGQYLAEDAIFFTETGTLRGREAILRDWRKYYEGKQAPFSWGPDQVEVFPSGRLAYSGGVVKNPEGKPIGRFSTIWRLEAPGQWKIVFDRGEPLPPGKSR
ncbi:DUF4440 domain-containing protein [Massilia sp. KIM]|uniref:YybH family protein n=1 Tax=Massilia sp. KIM TaxID=1955422 RepID=UPI00098FF547|nr:nuclear transport factor 2 family protein [Massilia sp. KIM]